MAKPELRREARRLRAEGLSVRAIARQLGVAQSTVSLWVRDVPLPGRIAVPAGALAMPRTRRLPVWSSTEVRRCARCKGTFPAVVFGRTSYGRQSWCRPCFRAHARERGKAHVDQVQRSKLRRRDLARAWVTELLGRSACADCAVEDPILFEFDHARGMKHGELSQMISCGTRLARIQAEVELCDIVCANCHRRRHALAAEWTRASPTWRADLLARGGPKARNQLFAYEALVASGCVDCGTRDLVVLDFDHLRDKTANVSALAHRGCSLATIATEIAKCEVRCANCHRRRTTVVRGHYRSAPPAPESA